MGLEIQSDSVRDGILYLELRPNINLHSLPIEKIIAKMRSSHLQLLDLLSDALRFEGVPSSMMQSLTALKTMAEARDPMWFNSTRNYRQATDQALHLQTQIFEHLASPQHGKEVDNARSESLFSPRTLFRVARLAAQAGEHKHAVDLLLLWESFSNGSRDFEVTTTASSSSAPPPLRREITSSHSWEHHTDVRTLLIRVIDHLLAIDCPEPWPQTMVALMSKDLQGYSRKTDHLKADDIHRMLVHAVNKRAKPFGEHQKVRLYQRNGPAGLWRFATMKQERRDGQYVVQIDGDQSEITARDGEVLAVYEGGLGATLRVAARVGEAAVVKSLLKAHVSLFEADNTFETALTLAAQEGQVEVCKVLYHHSGLDLKIVKKSFMELRNGSRQSAYDLAVQHRHESVQRLFTPSTSDTLFSKYQVLPSYQRLTPLQRGKAKDRKWKGGLTTLMLACREGDAATVTHLLNERADTHLRTECDGTELPEPCTALGIAAEDGRIEIVEELLAAGADADGDLLGEVRAQAGGGTWRLPLLLAAENGHVEVVQRLLLDGANPNHPRHNRSMLMCACQYGHTACAELLLDYNADLDFKGGHGGELNALDMACRFGHVETTRMLLDRGVQLVDRDFTALHTACFSGHDEIAKLVLERFPAYRDSGDVTPIHAAAQSGHQKVVLMLLERNADATKVNKKGQNALWAAAQNGMFFTLNTLCRREFLDKSPARNHIIERQALPLEHASTKDKPSQVLEKIECHVGTTPLMIATVYGHAECARVLLHAKADPFRTVPHEHAHCPSSALEIAAHLNSKVLCNVLLAGLSRSRLSQEKMDAIHKTRQLCQAGGDAAEILDKVLGATQSCSRSKRQLLVKAATPQRLSLGNQDFFLPEALATTFASLTWERGNAFPGQLLPPRPNPEELQSNATPMGSLVHFHGVVLQRGPFDGLFLRAGCVPHYQWVKMWLVLKQLIDYLLETEQGKYKRAQDEGGDPYSGPTIYVIVSLRAMQAIDFGWLSRRGFTFHHYREPGHGDSQPEKHQGSPEYVYKCWPGMGYQSDPVPAYATSIEGAFGLILSPDGTKALLVWERKMWGPVGGAANFGESKVEAVQREALEEVGATVELEKGMTYLGGYSKSAERDNLINDSFAAFAVYAKDETIQVDRKEIFVAKWFDISTLLEQWHTMGTPCARRVDGFTVPEMMDDPTKTAVSGSVLSFMQTYKDGRGLDVVIKTSQQGGKRATKAVWNMP